MFSVYRPIAKQKKNNKIQDTQCIAQSNARKCMLAPMYIVAPINVRHHLSFVVYKYWVGDVIIVCHRVSKQLLYDIN